MNISNYNKIRNPETNRYVNINSKLGKKVLYNYIKTYQSGGICGRFRYSRFG